MRLVMYSSRLENELLQANAQQVHGGSLKTDLLGEPDPLHSTKVAIREAKNERRESIESTMWEKGFQHSLFNAVDCLVTQIAGNAHKCPKSQTVVQYWRQMHFIF